MEKTQILVFGDSITEGLCDYKSGGWVNQLRDYGKKKRCDPHLSVYNLRVISNTTTEVVNRFEFELKQRLKEWREIGLIIFQIGLNDSRYNNITEHSVETTPKKFKENISELIKTAKKYSYDIVFLGLTPVDEEKTTPVVWGDGGYFKNKNIKKYDSIIKQVCDQNKVYYVNLFDNWIATNYKDLLEDGVHPNTKGHKVIFEEVKDFLEKEKII